MPEARTIDDVVAELDTIVAAAIATGDRIGLFAALYRQVTLKVKAGIGSGAFEDGPRMSRFDGIFAGRYLDALAAWRAGQPASQCWQLAFDATKRANLLLLQQLLLGMNAHINLDLGIAAAQTSPGAALPSLQTDFNRINQVLASLLDQVKKVVGDFSPLFGKVEKFDPSAGDALINFSMSAAREDAWQHAVLFNSVAAEQQALAISIVDDKATFLGRLVEEPGRLCSIVLDAVHLAESHDIAAVIRALNSIVP